MQIGERLAVSADGKELLFRPVSQAEAGAYVRARSADPSASFDTDLRFVSEQHAGEPAALEAFLSRAPLAATEIAAALVRQANARTREANAVGVKRWRRSGQNAGQIAENLLAFKAYSGGDPPAAAVAGALHIAEWLDNTRGIFRIFLAVVKALGRK